MLASPAPQIPPKSPARSRSAAQPRVKTRNFSRPNPIGPQDLSIEPVSPKTPPSQKSGNKSTMNVTHYTGPSHHSYISNRFRRFNNAMFIQQDASPPNTRPQSRSQSPPSSISSISPVSPTEADALQRISSASSRLSKRSSIRSSWSSLRGSFSRTNPRSSPKLSHFVEPKRTVSPSSVYSRASSNSSVKYLATPVHTTPLPLKSTRVPSTLYDAGDSIPRSHVESTRFAAPAPQRDTMTQYELAEAEYWAAKEEMLRRRRTKSSMGSVRSDESAYSTAPSSLTSF